MRVLPNPLEFEWDEGNRNKNSKHHIFNEEIEECFSDINKVIYKDIFHSVDEDRYIFLGKTKLSKLLYIVFTLRDKKVRIISARSINKKEIPLYEKKTNPTKI